MYQKDLPIAVINADFQLTWNRLIKIPIKNFNFFDLNILRNYENYSSIILRGTIREGVSTIFNLPLTAINNNTFVFHGSGVNDASDKLILTLEITINKNEVLLHVS